ncbi:DUF4861 domain-containing protein [Echinicola vietnamensis]|uniref:DUF4861 domain-containing protein n=1 Tax=Echinicola vietnamensis (strain DSM 17526 / LMG 23754 / KMM 6221) TaxID=926556 RepID=L0FXZ4_ECHVK|nr:DUF4861 domain-containing protein [Echinicola vietnamensis]AGA77923.1 hypothetical protein Echvi_1658 [Echinicola vietnamensis DSM 17526]
MKHSFWLVGSAVFLACACSPETKEEKPLQFTVTNQAALALTDKPVTLKRGDFPDLEGHSGKLPLVISAGDTIATQWDDTDGDGKWDELFFVTDLAANDTKTYTVGWAEEAPEFAPRTSVRFGKREGADIPLHPAMGDTLPADGLPKSVGYQPYQTDGPTWENDKVGFRHYFDGRNAKDLFGKKTSAMSPEDVGISSEGAVEDNYHVMHDWGRDILAVGNSVGLGGVALMIDGEPARLGVTVNDAVNNVEESVFQIVKEGPVRSVIQYNYNNWQTHERSYDVQEVSTIWPGMYAYKNAVSVEGLQGDETLLVGLVNINNDREISEIEVNDEWVVLLTHDQQSYEKEWWLGMALILPKAVYEGYTEAPEEGPLSKTYLAKLAVENGQPVEYFAAAGWELSDEQFTDREYFTGYITNLVQQLSAKVAVNWEANGE